MVFIYMIQMSMEDINVNLEVSIDDDIVNDIEEDVDGNEEAEKVDNSTTPKATNKGRGKKRRRSKCWDQFEKLPLREDGVHLCKCKFCRKNFSCATPSGTGHLLRHMKICTGLERDVGQMLLSSTQGNMNLSDGSFNSDIYRQLLAEAITMHNLPFQFVEFNGIRALHQYLHPGVQHICRNTAKADILKIYVREKTKIKNMFAMSNGRISLTSDMWSAINSDGYIVITAHFIDRDWFLRKYILCLSYMPSPHTGIALADKMYGLLSEWGIIDKLSTLTLDNASANDVCVGVLKAKLNSRKALVLNGSLFHIRCCAHILNLIVQEGLKDVDLVVEKIRESVKYVRGSQSRKEKFLECVKSLSLGSRQGLRQDVPTRWNSTFLMLKSAIYYKTAFEHLGMSDSNYTNCPSMIEWDKADRLCKFLGTFYDLTCLFSGTKYPTANLFFPLVVSIYLSIKSECESDDEPMQRMATRMKGKFEKYWSNFNETLAIAVIFDPRYKFQFVDFAYRKLYGIVAEAHVEKVRRRLLALFDDYLQNSTSYAGSSSTASQSRDNLQTQENDVELYSNNQGLLSVLLITVFLFNFFQA